jgi:tetratricopeptide (TPR) repeat protein
LLRINWAIIAQGEFELGLYPEAERASLKRLQLSPSDDKDRHDHLERLAAAIYKQGEQARAAGDNRTAARHFLRVGKLAPQSSIRANADYDAATALFANQDWALAIPVLKAFINNYPSHKLRRGADEKLALAYEKGGDWRHAADAYEVLYRNETDSNKKRLLLWQIAEFYDKAKRPDDALQVYKRYVTAFPRPFDEAIEARLRVANIYKDKGELQSRRYWLGQIVAANQEGPATDRSRYLAATASLELAAPIYESYRQVRLVQPLKQNLKKKKELMQESIKAYTTAAEYGIEAVTTASTYRIAEIYNNFSRELFKSERPKGLSAEELEQYDILLEEQAYPFEEKAIAVHEVNAQRSFDGVYDDWVKKSFTALTKLNPVRYAKVEKSEALSHAIE